MNLYKLKQICNLLSNANKRYIPVMILYKLCIIQNKEKGRTSSQACLTDTSDLQMRMLATKCCF